MWCGIVLLKGTELRDQSNYISMTSVLTNSNGIFFSLNFDLKSRHTIWSLLFGGFAFWLKSNAVSQNMIQRYLSLPTLASARK